MRFDNARILTSRFPETFAFYRDVLGLTVTWGSPDENYASFTDTQSATTIGLFEQTLMTQAVGTEDRPIDALAQDRIALVFSVEDIDTVAADLRARDVALVTEPQDRPEWGIRTLHLRDPDGNLIEIFSPLRSES